MDKTKSIVIKKKKKIEQMFNSSPQAYFAMFYVLKGITIEERPPYIIFFIICKVRKGE